MLVGLVIDAVSSCAETCTVDAVGGTVFRMDVCDKWNSYM